MSNFVFLIDGNKIPMNPIHPSQARKLLDSGKAAVFRQYPFTLIMNRVVENIVAYPITLKIDPGSKFTGISLVNNKDEVIWGMELELLYTFLRHKSIYGQPWVKNRQRVG